MPWFDSTVKKETNGMTRIRLQQSSPDRSSGFSLIELMVTIVVAAVLLAIAIPNFRNLILSNQLTTISNEWVTAVNYARSEAIKRGSAAVICGEGGNQGGTALSAGCADNLAEVRARPAGDPDGTTVVRDGLDLEIPDSVTLQDTESVRFGGDGVGRQPGSDQLFNGLIAEVNTDQMDNNNLRCVYLETGTTVTTCTMSEDEGSGDCPSDKPPTPCNP